MNFEFRIANGYLMMTVLLLTLLITLSGLYFEDRNIEELRKASAVLMPDIKP